jgi:Papain family cysteine protease/Domain of unknown function (DUF4384)
MSKPDLKSHFIKIVTFFLVLFISQSIFAQKRPNTGMVVDRKQYKSTPYKAKLSTRSFKSLAPRASLEAYCPSPGDQGEYGTCVAFAAAYGMRTIMWAKEYNVTDKERINAMQFSPTFVYEKIKNDGDTDCQGGSNPINACELMKQFGVPLLKSVPYGNCVAEIEFDDLLEAQDYVISDYQTLWDIDYGTADDKVNGTKKALSEGYPVLLGMMVPESFYSPGTVWHSPETDGGPSGNHGLHAMCVVGYDDTKEGGCFRVMNSWTSAWADGGFVWIPYKEYGEYALLALQAYFPRVDEPTPTPEPIPTPTPVTPEPEPTPTPEPTPEPRIETLLKGSVEFTINTGTKMNASRVLTRNLVVEDDLPNNKDGEDLVAYRMNDSYASGTKFRFYVNTNTEAYIYAFATDLTGKVNKILPFDDLMSPHIGPNSIVAFPSDTKVVKMDENRGTDYMLILYSTSKLDVNDVLQKMQDAKGGLSTKMRAALGNRLIEKGDVKYDLNEIGFEVNDLQRGGVVPLMVEITHQ